MHILVIGGSSGIGLATVEQGLERGHHMRAFSRHASQMDLDHPNLEKFDGDATQETDLARALDGMDAVVVALGIKESLAMIWRKVTLFSDATRALLPLMETSGPRRLLVVTGFGAGDSYAKVSTLERIPFKLVLGEPYKDKDWQEALVKESGLDWTIVRPTILTNRPLRPGYKVFAESAQWRNGVISRKDVADFLIWEAEAGAHIRGEVVLAR